MGNVVSELSDILPAEVVAAPSGAAPKSWGAWASILWVVLAEGVRAAVDFAMDHSPLQLLWQRSYGWHVVIITISWAVPLIVLVLAVRLAHWQIAAYFAWRRPRATTVALGIVLVLALQLFGHALPYLLGGSVRATFNIADYRALMAPGTWPGLYVLRYWPAALYAPIVEETTYRGFLWRGLAASRLGNSGAWLLTSLFFAAVHYRYYIVNGTFFPGPFIGEFLPGLIFGWVRWRSNSTIASMLAHSAANIALAVGVVLAVVFARP